MNETDMCHVMIDLETLGTRSNAVILSIGAVQFDLIGNMPICRFHKGIDIQSCLDWGLQVDGATIEWWMNQKDENIKRIVGLEKRSLVEVLNDFEVKMLSCFEQYIRSDKNVYVWSQGSNFDIVLLENAYKAIGKKAWWKYSNVRDTRTLFDVANYKYVAKGGHDALDDALNQAKAVAEAYQQLKKGA
jgi:hypothetical protein